MREDMPRRPSRPGPGLRRARRLLELLEEESRLLSAGRIADVAAQTARRAQEVETLAAEGLPEEPGTADLLGRLRAAAARNLRLLEAYRAGLRAAAADIAEAAAAARAIGLYGADGGRLPDPAPPARSDRRT